jgi:hypothetical protein
MSGAQHNQLEKASRLRTAGGALRPPGAGAVHELLRCASSGYPDNGERCHAHVPASAAREAWRRERLLTHRSEGFFHFLWREGEWLAYGVADGGVRGVYCATHCSQRRARIEGVQASGATRQSLPAARVG